MRNSARKHTPGGRGPVVDAVEDGDDLVVGHPPGEGERAPAVDDEIVPAPGVPIEIGRRAVVAEAVALEVDPLIGIPEVEPVAAPADDDGNCWTGAGKP